MQNYATKQNSKFNMVAYHENEKPLVMMLDQIDYTRITKSGKWSSIGNGEFVCSRNVSPFKSFAILQCGKEQN